MSKARAEKWPNTIDALRTRKERERLERLEEEEHQRKMLDKKTAVMLRDERRKQVDAASRRLFNQTDRVKVFNSKVEFASILKERENQVRGGVDRLFENDMSRLSLQARTLLRYLIVWGNRSSTSST